MNEDEDPGMTLGWEVVGRQLMEIRLTSATISIYTNMELPQYQ